jgi:hypothetical protein
MLLVANDARSSSEKSNFELRKMASVHTTYKELEGIWTFFLSCISEFSKSYYSRSKQF